MSVQSESADLRWDYSIVPIEGELAGERRPSSAQKVSSSMAVAVPASKTPNDVFVCDVIPKRPKFVLKSLRIENFKSYSGLFEISPFPTDIESNPLVCVVGPNGSGKSNIMDAVAFCFNCADSTKLRGDGNSSNLISNCLSGEDGVAPSSASVSVTLTAPEAEYTFSRSVSRRGDSKYVVNGSVITLEKYRDRMKECGLDLKGSFLVFQGDVESLALAGPSELGEILDRVSGSADLKKDFEAQVKLKDAIENEFGKLACRKRELLAERKKLKNELIEMQKIDDLISKRGKVTDDFFLSKLWLANQQEPESGSRPTAEKDPKEIAKTLKEVQQQLEKKKGDRAKVDLKQSKFSRKLLVDESELRKCESGANDCRMQIDLNARKIDRISALVTSRKAKQACVEHKLIQVESKIVEIEVALESEAKVLDALSVGGEANLDLETDRNVLIPFMRESGWNGDASEFERKLSSLRSLEIPVKLGDSFDEVKKVEKEIIFNREQKQVLETRRTELSIQLEKNELNERQTKEKLEALETVVSEKSNLLKKLNKDLSLSKSAKLRLKMEKLENQKKLLLDELSDIKQSENEIARERNLRETVLELTSRFGKDRVLGRVVDLVSPVDARLGFAVQTAAGKFMDAILVKDVSVARDAVKWLKSEKKGSLTFIPVQDIAVAARISAAEECTFATDCVTIKSYCSDSEQLIKRGIQFVFGDTVVCETLAEARKISSNISSKVVTVNGERISGNGNITVGGAVGDSASSSRFGRNNVHEISSKLDLNEQETEAVSVDLKREEAAGEKVMGDIRKVEFELAAASSLLQTAKTEFARLNESVASIDKFLDQNCSEVQQRDEELLALESQKREKIDALKANVADLSRQFVSAFISNDQHVVPSEVLIAIGGSVNDPSQSVKSSLEEAKKNQKEKLETIQKSLHSLSAERKCLMLELEELGDAAQLEADELSARKNLASSERTLKAKEMQVSEMRNETTKLGEEIEAMRKSKTEIEAEIKLEILKIQAIKQELVEAEIAATKAEKSALRIRNVKVQILKEAIVRNANIPLKLAAEDLAMGSVHEVSRSILESLFMSLSSIVPFEPQQDRGEDSMESLIEEVIGKIDFDSLSSEVKRNATQMAKKGRGALFSAELERDFKQTLQEIETEIEAIGGVNRGGRSGVSAQTQIEHMDEELKKITSEADTVKARIASCSDELKRLRKIRNERFIQCFRFVVKKVDQLYKLLTSYASTGQPSLASASLDLEIPVTITSDLTSVEAFKSGIIFSLMPPFKRYTNIELLSGGEKTVAAVALQFALLSYSTPPFSMVDEIDAALDAENVAVLARFMKSAVLQQLIVISLKEKLYANADCLVGVYKDSHTNGSGLATLDLRPYPIELEAETTRDSCEGKIFGGPLMTPAPSSAPVTSRREGRVIAGGA